MAKIPDWPVEVVEFKDVEPLPDNPRKMGGRQRARLAAGLDRWGLVEPLVFNRRTGHLLGGHERFRKLCRDGAESAEMVVVDIDGDDEIPLTVTLNNPAIQGSFTNDTVELLREVEGSLGDAFGELGLDALRKELDDNADSRNPQNSEGGGERPPDVDPGPDPDEHTIVTCPRCKAQWRKSDDAVIAGGESP